MKRHQSCVVPGCESSGVGNTTSYYPFPKENALKRKWLRAINKHESEINKRSKVCSRHFRSDDYSITRLSYKNNPDKNSSTCSEWKVLKGDVVPTVGLPEKSTFKIKISKKDNSKEVKVEEVKVKEEKPDKVRMPKKHAPPVEITPVGRSRRQASKEALKQMQILLEDERDTIEIPSDDDIIPIDSAPAAKSSPAPPPKKKYKLSHRKSSDGNDREVLVLKTITNRNAENTLELDCWVEELEEVQKERIEKAQKEEEELQSKLELLLSDSNTKVIHKGDLCSIIEITEQVQSAIKSAQNPQPTNLIVNNPVASSSSSGMLVMDPTRLGLYLEPATTASTPTTTANTTATTKVYQAKVAVSQSLHQTQPTTSASPIINTRPMRTRRGGRASISPAPGANVATATLQSQPKIVQPVVRSTIVTRNAPQVAKGPVPVAQKKVPLAIAPAVAKTVPLVRTAPVTRAKQPLAASSSSTSSTCTSESNVEGGLGSSGQSLKKSVATPVVDLTAEDGRPLPDSKEISFNKLQGKTYPSLVVVARPQLRTSPALLLSADLSADRSKLDSKVKSVLMQAPSKFTEWLIQQGLVKSEQRCSLHTTNLMKLGMYSDVSKFPYSGGYVWITECCPQRFISVFNGSLFEASIHSPVVILKLLYHWACQTNIQNVTQWVKVDNLFVKNTFTWLRAICTVANQSHLRRLGGPGIKVEIGVISLGTTTQDGNQRQVKVEVLGVLETTSKLLRLRAVEPLTEGDKNYKKRFSKILEPIIKWVHPQSTLIADLTVDKQTLHHMGFANVVQSASNDPFTNNRKIMEYLRKVIPRMFQNTLSLLSRQIIQQFLDELVWRESFGTTALQAFENLVIHVSEQTWHNTEPSLFARLSKVAQNPFKNWAIPITGSTVRKPDTVVIKSDPVAPQPTSQIQKKIRGRGKPEGGNKVALQGSQDINRPPKSISPDVPEQMVPLENYYYGTIDTYSKTPNIVLNMKCPFCKVLFDNNIQLMSHLFKHAHNVSQDAQLCRYCLTSVPTANDLLKHIASSHPAETKFDNGFVCLICETQYMNPFVLGKHMSKEHCPSELPYQCGTCGYRCSNHKQVIDHFYKTHDNGPTIQCPFCLKSTTVFSSSRNLVQNMNYFIQHLQKHQRKQFARRCGKCNLWFVQKDVLRDHQCKMHASQRGKAGLVQWLAPRNGVMVPKSKMDKYPGDADVINFSTLFFNIPKRLVCKECDSPMDSPKHFPSFESCQNPNCLYSTCCTNAMQEHNAKCKKVSQKIPKEELPFEMFCICGYSNIDGNEMARHLTICERKSAYSSRSEAKAATVTHSMLDVLGLVRKPEELKSHEEDLKITKGLRTAKRKREENKADTENPEKKLALGEEQPTPVMEENEESNKDKDDKDEANPHTADEEEPRLQTDHPIELVEDEDIEEADQVKGQSDHKDKVTETIQTNKLTEDETEKATDEIQADVENAETLKIDREETQVTTTECDDKPSKFPEEKDDMLAIPAEQVPEATSGPPKEVTSVTADEPLEETKDTTPEETELMSETPKLDQIPITTMTDEDPKGPEEVFSDYVIDEEPSGEITPDDIQNIISDVVPIGQNPPIDGSNVVVESE